jgi:hypothetical protein
VQIDMATERRPRRSSGQYDPLCLLFFSRRLLLGLVLGLVLLPRARPAIPNKHGAGLVELLDGFGLLGLTSRLIRDLGLM